MGLVKNESIRVKADYFSVLGWYLDCYTGLLKNLLIYLELVKILLRSRRKKKERNQSP
jgi:hypothetical protein